MLRRLPFLMLALSAVAVAPAQANLLDGWLSTQPTEVLPVAQGGTVPGTAQGVIPFTTFEHERQQIMQKLPCKWLSMAGGSGLDRHDFLCKGGTWATVSLMLDKSAVDTNGIGRVRLIFREWPETVHPGGGEAYVAQQFLQHVANHFISAAVAREVQEAFWQKRDRQWRIGRSIMIGYTYEDRGQFAIRRLEILGRGAALEGRASQSAAPVTPTEAGLGEAIPGSVPHVPATAQPLAPGQQPLLSPRPADAPKRESVFQPLPSTPATDVSKLPLPRLDGTKPLENATEADVNTAPEPGTQKVPLAPAEVDNTLLPSAVDRVTGREKAPTNFEAYNKAEELTRDVEIKALEDSRKDSRIKPGTAQPDAKKVEQPKPGAKAEAPKPAETKPAETKPAPPVKPGESLQAVPTPTMGAVEEAVPLERPETQQDWPQGEGLGNPTQPAPGQPGSAIEQTAPGTASQLPSAVTLPGDPRYAPTRNLPQLKFIPKAVPLERVDEVIRFEDEGSGL